MLNDFREWLSDNLRYILLGLAVILILVIAYFAIRFVSGIGDTKKKDSEPQSQQASTETVTEAAATSKTADSLVRNQQDVLDLVMRYYAARAEKDYDTLATLCEVFNDNTQAEIERQDAAIEAYNNILTYSKAGLTEGSYIVYVYFDAKVTGISTVAPCLRELYLITDSEGNLIIADKTGSDEIQAFTEQRRTDSDVQALISDVDAKLEDAKAQDADLKNFIETDSAAADTQQNADGEDSGNEGGSQGEGTSSAVTGTMYANAGVNVRGEPSTDGTLYGTLYQGQEVEVLESADGGWYKVRYTVNGTTIEGYVKSEYLSAQ